MKRRHTSSLESNSPIVLSGSVTTNQLAAQLQALEMRLLNSVRFMFQQALQSVCTSMTLINRQNMSAFSLSPTLATRSFLNRTDLHERILGTFLNFDRAWQYHITVSSSYQLIVQENVNSL